MNELFIREQLPGIKEIDPDYGIAAARSMPACAWSDPRALTWLFYPLALLGA